MSLNRDWLQKHLRERYPDANILLMTNVQKDIQYWAVDFTGLDELELQRYLDKLDPNSIFYLFDREKWDLTDNNRPVPKPGYNNYWLKQ